MLEKSGGQPLLFAIGINHNTAPVEVREKLYLQEDELLGLSEKLSETLLECMVLSTCNRTEIYGVTDNPAVNLDFYKNLLIDFKNASAEVGKENFFSFVSCAATQQLFKVAASIDSKIVGDDQILQQLRNAYELAKTSNFTGKILNQLAQRAFKVGKKTYTETKIHKGAVSVGLAAVETAIEQFGLLADKTILIIGAGEMARLTAGCLGKHEVDKIYLTNRTNSKAEEISANLKQTDTEVIKFADFKNLIGKTDIIISSTSSAEYILRKTDFGKIRRETLVLDIAVPRNVDPQVAELDNVILRNVDDLNRVIDRNHARRTAEIPAVKKIIAQEMGDFLMWYYALPLLPKFGAAKGKPESEKVAELKEVKEFLTENVGLFHKLARQSNGNTEDDLKIHFELVRQLFELRSQSKKESSSVER